MSLGRHFLLVALHYPPSLEDRAPTPEERHFHAIARDKIRDDPQVRMVMKLNNAFMLEAQTPEPLEFKKNAFALHGYKWVNGERLWYENVQKLLAMKIIAPPEGMSCINQ